MKLLGKINKCKVLSKGCTMNLNLTAAMGSYLNNSNSNSSTILSKLVSEADDKKNSENTNQLNQSDDLESRYNTLSQSLNSSNNGLSMLNKALNSMDELNTLLDDIRQNSAKIVLSEDDENNLEIKEKIVSLISKYDQLIVSTNHKGIYPLNNEGEPVKIYVGMDDENVIDLKLEPLLSKDIGLKKPYVLGNFENGFKGEELKEPMQLDIDILNNGKSDTIKLQLPLDERSKGELRLQAAILLGIVNQAIQVINRGKSEINDKSKHLEVLTKNVLNLRSNIRAAQAQIATTNYSEESSLFNKFSVLNKMGSFILSQANNVSKQKVQSLVA